MRHLARPVDENALPFAAGEVFETSVSMVQNANLRTRLRGVRPLVESESADYDAKAAVGQLYQKQPHVSVGVVSASEMVGVYTLRMVPKTSKGRQVYNRIMSMPAQGRCPFCGIGTVNTLDHYLPKTRFPVYAVTPNNLVPACTWCQGEKAEYYSTTADKQLLHPYFDDVDDEIWLAAEVVIGVPAGFRFYASPPNHWSPSEMVRVSSHLKELNLPVLFSSNAGSRLAEIRARLTKLHQKGRAVAVQAHLLEELASIEADQINSWVAAMYRAACASDWFSNGGFSHT